MVATTTTQSNKASWERPGDQVLRHLLTASANRARWNDLQYVLFASRDDAAAFYRTAVRKYGRQQVIGAHFKHADLFAVALIGSDPEYTPIDDLHNCLMANAAACEPRSERAALVHYHVTDDWS